MHELLSNSLLSLEPICAHSFMALFTPSSKATLDILQSLVRLACNVQKQTLPVILFVLDCFTAYLTINGADKDEVNCSYSSCALTLGNRV